MGQSKREWDSEQERKRKAEYRARKRLEELQAKVAPVDEPVVPDELTSEEAGKLEEARQGAAAVSAELREGEERAGDRLARAERYFHWRLASWRAGETASPW